jgi:hypothetical protein
MFFSKQENLLKQKRWMIYGANGYTGELVAREAKRRELLPVLAGRSEAKISALANELRLRRPFFRHRGSDGGSLPSQQNPLPGYYR